MSAPAVRNATADDALEVSAALGAAFMEDPVFRWLFPDEARRRELIAGFFEWTLQTVSLPLGEVWCTDDRQAAALWAPPPDRWRLDWKRQAQLLPHLLGLVRFRAPRILMGFNRLESRHPHEPHWYLYFLGTHPEAQGRGHGSALMQHMLERSDSEGIPAFLEAPNPAVVPFYIRHGFAVTGEVAVRHGPTFAQMWRDPR